jgi:DNA-binding MarR family transcriptional regulator
LLAELERTNLIDRTRSESDRREIRIKITAKGRKALIDDMAMRRAWLDTTMQAMLTAAEVEALLASSLLMLKLAAYEPLAVETAARG